ncbi:MAG: hypothetical protein IJ874_00905 [Ruminococcus sp.]|nr:hypothetical protein [Ruminococcus sp.]
MRHYFSRGSRSAGSIVWESVPLSTAASALIGISGTLAVSAIFSAVSFFIMKSTVLSGFFGVLSLMSGSFSGACVCGRYRRHGGLYTGIRCAAAMYILLAAAALSVSGTLPEMKKLLLLAVSGCAGGVSGVNSKKVF